MSRIAFGVRNEPKTASEYIASKIKCHQSKPYTISHINTNNLNVNLITKLDLANIEVVGSNKLHIDPNGTLFGSRPHEKQNYLRYLVAR